MSDSTVASTPPVSKGTAGLRGITRIDQLDLKDKKVFMRVDFNVPTEAKKTSSGATSILITDDRRIRSAIPSIKYALEKGARLILGSHFGRPKNAEDRDKYTMEPIARRLGELLNAEIILIDEPTSDAPKNLLPSLKSNQILLLENLRFDKGEEKNSSELASQIATYTEVYVNDAFGACHRAHASIDALPRLVTKKGIGFLVAKEIEYLDALMHSPEKPYVAILGGAKVSDKIPVIEKMMEHVDSFMIGGAMSYTFLAAKGLPVGDSRVEKDRVPFAAEMIKRCEARGKKLLLPVDHVIVEKFESDKAQTTSDAIIPSGFMALDIGPKTIELYRKELSRAKTIFWNGPMGVFERETFAKGTFGIAKVLSELENAKTIVGGGDSAAAAEASGYSEKMSHISTGGGASLEYLQGEKLPGLEVLRNLRPGITPTLEGSPAKGTQ